MARPWGLAVTSGKGGVGKSCVALNLAVALGRLGQRVLLVDADLGLGNLAIMLGVNPEHTLESVLQGSCPAREADTARIQIDSGGLQNMRCCRSL